MEATSICQSKNMIIELIKQPLFEKIEGACSNIEEALGKGSINLATQTIKDLASWFEDLVWTAYLNSLFQCAKILEWLRMLGSKKAMRFVSYQKVWISLPTGTKIQIRSPFLLRQRLKEAEKNVGRKDEASIYYSLSHGIYS